MKATQSGLQFWKVFLFCDKNLPGTYGSYNRWCQYVPKGKGQVTDGQTKKKDDNINKSKALYSEERTNKQYSCSVSELNKQDINL